MVSIVFFIQSVANFFNLKIQVIYVKNNKNMRESI